VNLRGFFGELKRRNIYKFDVTSSSVRLNPGKKRSPGKPSFLEKKS